MRARNLKPGFFKNELLARCDPHAQILFQGLWCLADREGRLEDRVDRIKAEIRPYTDCDVDALLNELQESGFILRYSALGGNFIVLPTFMEHQRPHPNEPKSKLPPPKRSDIKRLRKRGLVTCNEDSRLFTESPFIESSSSRCHESAAAADSISTEMADLIVALQQRGLSPELARLHVTSDEDLPLVRAVLRFHAAATAAKKLRNPLGALRSMLADYVGWGFSRTDAGDWEMPSDVRPPAPGADPKVETIRCREQTLADQRRKEHDQAAGLPITLGQRRREDQRVPGRTGADTTA